jgi:hypothetical protein
MHPMLRMALANEVEREVRDQARFVPTAGRQHAPRGSRTAKRLVTLLRPRPMAILREAR